MLKSTLERLRETRTDEMEGEGEAEAGFTLIELMVVLLIIAILLAIAIPTFLGVTGSANDRAAQSNLTNALTEVKAQYQNSQTYCEATATCASGSTPLALATLNASAPEFSWVNTTVTPGNNVSVQPVDVGSAGDGQGVILATMSKNANTCWFVVDLEATPITTAFTEGTGEVQFLAGTASTAQWVSTNGAVPGAGVYYSKVVNDSGSCNASVPANASQWNWGTSYSNAPGS